MIKATLTFDCGGCDARAEVDGGVIRSRFRSFSGRDYGFGVYRTEWPALDALEDLAPEGWMAFDPYTRCTYCPKCVAEIFEEPTTEAVTPSA